MFNNSTIEKLFLSVCGETLRSTNGFKVRGELGTYSHALVVWLGITKRLNGGSLSDALRVWGCFAPTYLSARDILLCYNFPSLKRTRKQ